MGRQVGTLEGGRGLGVDLRRLVAPFEGPLAAYIGGVALFVGAISTYWDIATHIDIGRERFLTPAHIGLYASVLVSAIALALSGLADHFRAGDSFVSALRHPFQNLRPGVGVAGAGMLTTLAAAPLDNAWHEVYGIDVTIWSPPHLLAIFGISAAALGLAVLLSPAAGHESNRFYPLALTGFLTSLMVTTGEYEFNIPQFRIAYHPVILAAISALVFTAASGVRWRATQVALWFELVRLASVLFLVMMGRSLPFIALLIPAGLVADAMGRTRTRGVVPGLAIAAMTVITNWLLLEALPGLTWPPDDLVLGAPAALFAGAIMGRIGWHIGQRLDGSYVSRTRKLGAGAPAIAVLLLITMIAAPAVAHEVGGRRGSGTIEWSPRIPEAGQGFTVEVSDVELTSGATPTDLRVEAWRAEHRISSPVLGNRARVVLPEQGLWFLFVRARAGDENLAWGDHFTVAEVGNGVPGVRHQRFALALDTLNRDEPPAWVDALAYAIAIALALVLVRGVVRALNRLSIRELSRA